MNNMAARLRKLETQITAEDAFPRHYVLWDDDPYPQDLRPQDLVVRLARKALDVRRRNPEFFEGGMR